MKQPDREGLDRRLRWWAALFFAALLILIALANAFTTIADHARLGHPMPAFNAFVSEFTSILIIGALIPLLAAFNRRMPIDGRTWRWALPTHLVATLPFSIVHVAGMVGLRKLVFALVGGRYDFGPVLASWLYEYRKDFVSYWLLVAGLYGFASYRRWRLSQLATVEATGTAPLERLVVRRLNREFILNLDEIDRIEASGNYVEVHAAGTNYRLRESLASLAARLDEHRFVQVHRRHIVNIDRIREIQPWDSGDYRIVLKDGDCVNLSRRYRSRLDSLVARPATQPSRDAAQP
ncbi:MAG TPA: LytTR family DNA-binding domain-containing protein [Gammaproteobacteria bacterium]|nr:LytTR family DNA-binding domain-containing protein [Gammaproteobacteria bacterium]